MRERESMVCEREREYGVCVRGSIVCERESMVCEREREYGV